MREKLAIGIIVILAIGFFCWYKISLEPEIIRDQCGRHVDSLSEAEKNGQPDYKTYLRCLNEQGLKY